jgi:hypothetical protein
MNKPHVCMFCRYKKARAKDLEFCCAGAALLHAPESRSKQTQPSMARGMPERLRYPSPEHYQASR